ncbi:GNAT family N-acetyltransferase [Nocardioides sp. Soil805]|uniref:GNAT family N-acetyltransferase n=1 Tax=Nocardioides sp. Soil805 TaxID=1736416 RepID=UPI0007028404|nr:GNAT family N-acetyltransferase [Nocardioides sp. Soil805]KRF35466.1 GCN5 family acetyltransferase [Nocardioides sp. Soil805]
MLADAWPLFGLTIETPRLRLRLPRDEEVAELARVAADGVHTPHERPFLTPWTEGSAEDRAHFVLQQHWGALGDWEVRSWALGLGIFLEDRPIGRVTLRAQEFPVVREVTTSSWLGLPHHGQGFGTEARAGVLTLAFDHLGAEAAVSEVFQDNHASQGVSRRLGYEPDGISRDARGDEVLVSDRLRLTSKRWSSRERPVATIVGLDAARSMFGV